MRILHFYGDWKWTGPAEPTVELARALAARGHEVLFCLRRAPRDAQAYLRDKVREAGLPILAELPPTSLWSPWQSLRTVRQLRRLVEQHRIEIVHVHQDRDHWVARLALEQVPHEPPLLRTNHQTGLRNRLWDRLLSWCSTDGVVGFSWKHRKADAGRFGVELERSWIVPTAVDLSRFHGELPSNGLRKSLGLDDGDIIAGIVARMQRHRKFHLVMASMARASREVPNLRLLVIGRGTHWRKVVLEPAQRYGVEQRVIFAGYRTGDYEQVLNAIDFEVFLVPGSDGTCRAVREAMALGKPVIASSRGILPELVNHGSSGLVVDETVAALASAIVRLASDRELRQRLGQAALRKARREFSLERQAEEMEKIYRKLIELTARPS